MLKPMNSMEMRIQRVEEQLESLSKNSCYSGLPPGTRIVAPQFSCNFNTSSFHNDGSDSDRKEFTAVVLLNPHERVLDSANAPWFLPSLVVTAPDCSENEQDDMLEPLKGNNQEANVSSLKDSPGWKPKLCLIDDVLAVALSNFLLSTSDNPAEYPSECKQTILLNILLNANRHMLAAIMMLVKSLAIIHKILRHFSAKLMKLLPVNAYEEPQSISKFKVYLNSYSYNS